jgi:queuine/archaeosine tRNA-ribosyltransferase
MLSLHNLRHLGLLMAGARQAIESGGFHAFTERRRRQLAQGVES